MRPSLSSQDALLTELSGSPSRYDQRPETANRLAVEGRIFGFLEIAHEVPIGAVTISDGTAVYVGGMCVIITALYVFAERRSGGVAVMVNDVTASAGRTRGRHRIEIGMLHLLPTNAA